MRDTFIERIIEIQTAHAGMMGSIRDALGDTAITPEAAVTILCIGDQTVTPTEVKRRGYYAGTNFSYNHNLLLKAGLIERSPHPDRRSVKLRLTSKGLELVARLRADLDRKRRAA